MKSSKKKPSPDSPKLGASEPQAAAPQPAAKPTGLKIELDPTRSKLSEGRNKGVSYAFLKRLDENTYKGVHPVSACKDYLNDVVFVERTEVDQFSACGLTAKKAGIFDTHGYLLAQSLESLYGYAHPRLAEEQKLMKENMVHTQKALNELEEMLKVKDRTELTYAGENMVLAKLPIEWTKSTWMISLWGYMYRNLIHATGGPVLEEVKKSKDSDDLMYLKYIELAIKRIIEKGIPEQKRGDFTAVHGNGIINWVQTHN